MRRQLEDFIRRDQSAERIAPLAASIQRLQDISAHSEILTKELSAGFQRLDADVVTLASNAQQHVSLLARAILDQGEISAALRELARRLPEYAGHGLASASGSGPVRSPRQPVVVPLTEGIPPSLLDQPSIRELVMSDAPVWCLRPELLPQTNHGLPCLLELMATCREVLRHPEKLVWVQPTSPELNLSTAEAEQVLGLAASVERLDEVVDRGQRYFVVLGTVRQEMTTPVLRWSMQALDELHHRLRALLIEALRETTLASGLHAVDLPAPHEDAERWATLLPTLAEVLCGFDNAPVGVVLPPDFADVPAAVSTSLERLRAALREQGHSGEVAFQWVRGAVRLEQSAAILRFAREHGIPVDMTAVSRMRPESRMQAYDDLSPYRPLSFDLRAPSFAPADEGVIEIARWSGRSMLASRAGGGGRDVPGERSFDWYFAGARERLIPVLDRTRQRQFESQANLDTTLVPFWPTYFVYNWPPPRAAVMQVVEFDAAELAADGSPLSYLKRSGGLPFEGNRNATGLAFLKAARQFVAARKTSHVELRSDQIESHRYLRDRDDLTADAERLIDWMPDRLGLALEIGSGYGVMARRVRHRASRYVACDLTVEQGAALRELGASPLVADIHRLPFTDEAFETIIADNVIEHASDPLQVLTECHRVLRGGGAAYMIIPHDYQGPEFRNRSHLWKADADSTRVALELAGFRIVRHETICLAEFGVGGAFPSSGGMTGLWCVQKVRPAVDAESTR